MTRVIQKNIISSVILTLSPSDTMQYKGKQLEFTDNSIGFFPSDADYTRITNRDKMIVVHFKAFNYHANEIESFLNRNSASLPSSMSSITE